MVDGVFAAAQNVAAVATVRIFYDARSPVTRGHVGDVEGAVPVGVPPLQFDNLFEAQIGDQVKYVMRHDQRGRGAGLAAGLARDGSQRLAMQVIEVRMSYEDDIHWR